MSSWSTPSPDAPIAPTRVVPRYTGTPPANTCAPLASCKLLVVCVATSVALRSTPAQPGPTSPATAPATYRTCCNRALMLTSSCQPTENTLHCPALLLKGPFAVPSIPSGNVGRDRSPTARL